MSRQLKPALKRPEDIIVLVVDDSAVVRHHLAQFLRAEHDIAECIIAADGEEALRIVSNRDVDVMVLDIEMPTMDGIETLRALRSGGYQLPVIMFSILTDRGTKAPVDALLHGASDYISKPSNTREGVSNRVVQQQLLRSIRLLASGTRTERRSNSTEDISNAVQMMRAQSACPLDVVVVGSSTGGPSALARFLAEIPVDFPAPILIAQHMADHFTGPLVSQLDAICSATVRQAESGNLIGPGEVWLAPGNQHLLLRRTSIGISLIVDDGPAVKNCRPSVDRLFRSASEAFGNSCVGVILTGMGSDGTQGCHAIRKAGGTVLAQDEKSSVVWGMPRGVMQAGLAHHSGPPEELATTLIRWSLRQPSGRLV